jgi:hypothetical protein
MIDAPAATPMRAAATGPSLSAISWAAIIGGAFVAMSVSLILLSLGSGLGFSATSAWPNQGLRGLTVTAMAAIWLIITQWLSAAVGGYLAGRLRTRWIGTHVHEVFFRDTAHGLITWALATLMVAALLGSTLFASIGVGARGASQALTQAAGNASSSTDLAYFTDRFLRPAESPGGAQSAGDPRPEVARIVANAVATGALPDADRAYLASMVTAHTGVDATEAQRRTDELITSVNTAETKARQAADTARKAAAQASIYLALALLVGAFIASVSAVLGGHLRDEQP